MNNTNEELFNFIKKCPTAFHTASTITDLLKKNGFIQLQESEDFHLKSGAGYFCIRNDSSLIAFKIGRDPSKNPLNIMAAHGDSPCFKLKEKALIEVKDSYFKLDTEGYGGMLCSSWLDRPLSLAGRAVTYNEADGYKTRLFDFNRDLCLIPSLAIHMNRKANEGVSYNKQIDMLPLFSLKENKADYDFNKLISGLLGLKNKELLAIDAYVYNRQEPSIWGASEEFISAPRLDDLQCSYACLQGFLQAENPDRTLVYLCFNNEEVGSQTYQGAASSFLSDMLDRITSVFNGARLPQLLAQSFLISADNAHALHPNFPEKSDVNNYAVINKGIVLKANAAQKYSTDAIGSALCRNICNKADIPLQFYSNRSDEAGGSTLGNIAICRVPIKGADIGLPQLSMHSAYETAGSRDTDYLIAFSKKFYDGKHKFC